MIARLVRRALLATFSHRTLALLRWDFHFMRVRAAGRLGMRRRAVGTRLRSSPRPIYLNLGSGPRGLDSPHWINVDGFLDRHVHHVMDVSRPFPFPSNTFDGIFSEHVMEHFDLDQGRDVLLECLRVLRPAGTLRIIVPDGRTIMRAYFDDPRALVRQRQPQTGCAMEAVNSYFRQRYEHQCIYDFDLMEHILSDVGFVDVREHEYRRGRGPADVLIDDPKYEWESLYVEAAKPARASQ